MESTASLAGSEASSKTHTTVSIKASKASSAKSGKSVKLKHKTAKLDEASTSTTSDQESCLLQASSQATCKRQVSPPMKKKVAYEQQYKCGKCSKLLDEHHEIDHKQPLWNGGTNNRSNLWALCSSCHKNKTAQENNWRFHFQIHQTQQTQQKQHTSLQGTQHFAPPCWDDDNQQDVCNDAEHYLPNYF
jgi:5-methylcytosine-specific restriction endonuclease McrA